MQISAIRISKWLLGYLAGLGSLITVYCFSLLPTTQIEIGMNHLNSAFNEQQYQKDKATYINRTGRIFQKKWTPSNQLKSEFESGYISILISIILVLLLMLILTLLFIWYPVIIWNSTNPILLNLGVTISFILFVLFNEFKLIESGSEFTILSFLRTLIAFSLSTFNCIRTHMFTYQPKN